MFKNSKTSLILLISLIIMCSAVLKIQNGCKIQFSSFISSKSIDMRFYLHVIFRMFCIETMVIMFFHVSISNVFTL